MWRVGLLDPDDDEYLQASARAYRALDGTFGTSTAAVNRAVANLLPALLERVEV